VDITDRGPNSVAVKFSAAELLVIVNALESGLSATDPEDVQACRQVQRPLIDALRYLRPKADRNDGRWVTDWARGDDGKHI